MLTDFTRDNGATLLLPASHRDGALPRRLGPESHADYAHFKRHAVAATGRAGDLLVYSGQVWHSIGVNMEERSRAALLGQLLPFFIRPMEAHAWTLPMGVQARLSSKVKRLLGINWHFFFQHSFRLAPLPRGPLAALCWLFDALWYGYPSNVHLETLRQGVALAEMPAWADKLLLAVAPVFFQLHRWICLAAMLIIPVALHNCAFGRRLSAFTVSLLSLLIGLYIGSNLTLERVRM
uniref:Uncharacterized protein n=2 Tax=Chrysotila carterae TaxID=13221 RepID=A0A7S4C736_CHRCT